MGNEPHTGNCGDGKCEASMNPSSAFRIREITYFSTSFHGG